MQKIEKRIEMVPTEIINTSNFKRKPAERNVVMKLKPFRTKGSFSSSKVFGIKRLGLSQRSYYQTTLFMGGR